MANLFEEHLKKFYKDSFTLCSLEFLLEIKSLLIDEIEKKDVQFQEYVNEMCSEEPKC